MSAQLALNLRLKEGLSFGNYLATANAEAVAQLRALSSRQLTEQIVFLHGPAGTGRTHLLQALCREAQAVGRHTIYIPLAERGALTPAILEDLEGMALVCVDDVEQIAGLRDWEEALFALCERLRASGGTLVAAGARAPAELGLALADLSTRLGWGPVYALKPLSDAEKIEAVRLRAGNRGLELTDEVARYILARYPRDLDSLFALLDRLDAAALAAQRRLTIPFLRSLEGL